MDLRPLIAGVALLAAAACTRDDEPAPALPQASATLAVPDEYIQAGNPPAVAAMPNPYANDASAIARGRELFARYNCDGCHGDDAVGNFCPALNDGRWNYGGSAAHIAESIRQGRPLGMPSFGDKIAGDDLWRLVAYIQSLEPKGDIATQNVQDWSGGERQGTRASEESSGGQ
jgi:cytochrome c oxidase cbb3-type subunit 3